MAIEILGDEVAEEGCGAAWGVERGAAGVLRRRIGAQVSSFVVRNSATQVSGTHFHELLIGTWWNKLTRKCDAKFCWWAPTPEKAGQPPRKALSAHMHLRPFHDCEMNINLAKAFFYLSTQKELSRPFLRDLCVESRGQYENQKLLSVNPKWVAVHPSKPKSLLWARPCCVWSLHESKKYILIPHYQRLIFVLRHCGNFLERWQIFFALGQLRPGLRGRRRRRGWAAGRCEAAWLRRRRQVNDSSGTSAAKKCPARALLMLSFFAPSIFGHSTWALCLQISHSPEEEAAR